MSANTGQLEIKQYNNETDPEPKAETGCSTDTNSNKTEIERVKSLGHVDHVTRDTQYHWSDKEYYWIRLESSAYSCEKCLPVLLELNAWGENERQAPEVRVPVGNVFK